MTSNCYVLIIDHSWLSEAEIRMFMVRLDAMATFDDVVAEAIVSCTTSSVEPFYI